MCVWVRDCGIGTCHYLHSCNDGPVLWTILSELFSKTLTTTKQHSKTAPWEVSIPFAPVLEPGTHLYSGNLFPTSFLEICFLPVFWKPVPHLYYLNIFNTSNLETSLLFWKLVAHFCSGNLFPASNVETLVSWDSQNYPVNNLPASGSFWWSQYKEENASGFFILQQPSRFTTYVLCFQAVRLPFFLPGIPWESEH